MSSETAGYVETLLGDAERSSSSITYSGWWRRARPGHVYRFVPIDRLGVSKKNGVSVKSER